MIDLITTAVAARMIGCAPETLRKCETADGRWCTILGYSYKFRVYNYGGGLNPTRRYDRNEILRVLRDHKKAE